MITLTSKEPPITNQMADCARVCVLGAHHSAKGYIDRLAKAAHLADPTVLIRANVRGLIAMPGCAYADDPEEGSLFIGHVNLARVQNGEVDLGWTPELVIRLLPEAAGVVVTGATRYCNIYAEEVLSPGVAQQELAALDWRVLRELERCYLLDSPLNLERERLRVVVDRENGR